MFFVIKQKSIIIVGLIFIIVFTTSFFILSFATNEPESCDLMHEVKEKYHVPTSKIRNIQQGDRYFGDYIFKYSK